MRLVIKFYAGDLKSASTTSQIRLSGQEDPISSKPKIPTPVNPFNKIALRALKQ